MAKNIFIIFCICLLSSCQACSKVERGEGTNTVRSVTVNGTSVDVHETLVSKWPTNKFWDGTQRDKSETEAAWFTSFEYKEGQSVSITLQDKVKGQECVVRPAALGIKAEVTDNKTIVLSDIPGPCQFVVETGGHHNALHVFVNPADAYSNIDKSASDVLYFGPGKHTVPGGIYLKSGQTLFIDEGATVYSYICAQNASDIKITGTGILDCSRLKREEGYPIKIADSKNVVISGIVINDPTHWTAIISNCKNVEFDNVKVIGCWRYNSDGFDICNTSNVRIHDCFLRCFDDNIVIKGLSPFYNSNHNIIENVDVRNCVLWNDWGQALEIGAETVADEIRNVTYDSCYIIHSTFNAMDIQNTDKAHVHDIHYSNIHIEEPIYLNATLCGDPMDPDGFGGLINIVITKSQWSTVKTCGKVSDITYENIYYTGTKAPRISFSGYTDESDINNISIRNCQIGGKAIDQNFKYIKNQYVSNIKIE